MAITPGGVILVRILMADQTVNVLFLCTGNSCRSIIAESLLNHLGEGRRAGFSAGSHPAGRVNPWAIRVLEKRGLPTEGLKSKSWDVFAAGNEPGAPVMDVIITVCDNAAGGVCPVWPGGPVSAHWGIPDPALFLDNIEEAGGNDEETETLFLAAFERLERRIRALLELPLEALDGEELKHRLNEIGAIANDNA